MKRFLCIRLFPAVRNAGQRLIRAIRSMLPICVGLMLIATAGRAWADAKTQLARETADYLLARFGGKAIKEGGEVLAARIGRYASKYGDEFIPAVRKVGPRAFELVDMAGANAPRAMRVMEKYGEEGVTQVLSRKTGLALLEKYGDEAAAAMVKHPGIAEPLIEKLGPSGIRALEASTPQAARRLSMMVESGELAKIGRTEQLLGVIERFGNKAMDFVWKNKESLAVAAVLTAFLENPEPFIDGTKEVTKTVAENVAKPLAAVPGQVAEEAARNIDWTPVALVVIVVTSLLIAVRTGLFRNILRGSGVGSSRHKATPPVTDSNEGRSIIGGQGGQAVNGTNAMQRPPSSS